MDFLRRSLTTLRSHKRWGWVGLILYACAVSFPHQQVQELVGMIADRVSLKHVYQASATIAIFEAGILTFLFLRTLRGQVRRRWLVAYWLLSIGLIVMTWAVFTANDTELVHYPQYFPEGVALLALTLSPAESLAWIAILGGLDEAFQYTFLVAGRPLPYDFNDVYMDLVGGAAGVIFAIAVLGCKRRAERASVGKLVKRPGIALLLSIVGSGIVLWASGKMLLYEAPGNPSHWFSLSRLQTPSFWYFSPVILGPHHFHELSPIEGPILILATIVLYGVLDRRVAIAAAPDALQSQAARSGK